MIALCWMVAAVGSGVLSGCHQQGATSTSSSPVVKTYNLRGKIVSADPATGLVTIDGESVPGYMDAMTMSYKLKDKNVATELHPGDRITAKILVGSSDDDTVLDEIVIISQAKPDYKPAAVYHVPQAGEPVPNFAFLNQSGLTRHLHDYTGEVLLITFIYTRCPLTDYCIRMSRNFAEIDKQLNSDPAIYSKTHLLSISFDPAYDVPSVLRSYGEEYTGRGAKETFAHWEFAATPKQELPKVEQFFDLGVTTDENKSISHSLSTIVVGRDGKVVAWYPTNEWSPQDVEDVMRKAARGA